MARVVGKLAPAKVTALAKAKRPGLYGDGAGLWLRIGQGGAASWVLRYMRGGKAHEMGLGPLHTYGLAEAREWARRYRQELHDGIDPLASRAAAKASAKPIITFGQVAEMYLTAHAPSWRSEIHRRQWRQTLDQYVLPTLRDRSVTEIDTGAVMEVIEPLRHVKPETAARVRGRIESVLDYATARGWRSGPNPAAWSGHLKHVLPAKTKVRKVEHHAALPWQDVASFMEALRQRQGIAARAVEFLVLTACRSGEVRGARWDEIDRKSNTWTVPASRTKTAQDYRVPLSDAALVVIERMEKLRDEGEELVFPGAERGRVLSDVALSKIAKLCAPGAEITLHGFRSTFRDWAGEASAYPREVIEMALGHRLGDKAEQAYETCARMSFRDLTDS
ncbi:MAG TPA: integrase arm-type DNA-binding domain-containing protein [Acetobacteraceae bacterium]|nr:integrase arm-type DNA-binding domain-containing protein [Acetobacteraceae bacterium]